MGRLRSELRNLCGRPCSALVASARYGANVMFRLLGVVEADVGGRPIKLGWRQERCLLALLLLEGGRPIHSQRLAELIWEGEPPADARAALQVVVARLRSHLNAADAAAHGVRLLTKGDSYALGGPAGERRRRPVPDARRPRPHAAAPGAGGGAAAHRPSAVARAGAGRRGRAVVTAAHHRAAGGAAADRAGGADGDRARGRPPPRADRRAHPAGRRASAARAVTRPADGRAEPRGSPGRRARLVRAATPHPRRDVRPRTRRPAARTTRANPARRQGASSRSSRAPGARRAAAADRVQDPAELPAQHRRLRRPRRGTRPARPHAAGRDRRSARRSW